PPHQHRTHTPISTPKTTPTDSRTHRFPHPPIPAPTDSRTHRFPHPPTQNNHRRTFSLLPTLNLNALDLTKLSHIDLTDPSNNGEALDTLNEVLDTLPLAIEFWALNRTAGVVGMSLDMGLAELADVGLVSFGKQGLRTGSRGRNAKVHVDVTITGLVDWDLIGSAH
ncbi:uncharacterized protein BO66DRAFT_401916, partial [Aspergillus aculeatinus CBS 121060]